MPTILCYGDSNTWGLNPASGQRYERDQRWPGVLRIQLGHDYEVVEEGLQGRTTVFNDPLEDYKSGKAYLMPCLQSHAPLDLVIFLLGANDVQTRYNVSALEISLGMGVLVEMVLDSTTGPGGSAPDVLLLAPPPLGAIPEVWADSFIGGREKSRRLAEQYRRVADEYSIPFYDTAEVVTPAEHDGVHWDASEHEKLGKALARLVRVIVEPA
jgi:lysophospholipase L1-like esterase